MSAVDNAIPTRFPFQAGLATGARFSTATMPRNAIVVALFIGCSFAVAHAQGGPPYYTTDPGTPGNKQWEINFGYMPFLYEGQSVTHTPDVDINFGVGDRIQLTYEDAWLRV